MRCQGRLLVFVLSLCWLLLAPASAHDRGALFKVSANGHTMHLFGTMHVGMPQFYPLEPRIREAVANASTLAVEFDPEKPAAELARAVREYGTLARNDDGAAKRSDAQRSRLEQMVRQAGLDPAFAATLNPALLSMLLSVSEFEKLGYRPDLSTDRYLARQARSNSVRVMELESVEEQLALLGTLSSAEQWRFLDETVAVIESGAQQKEARNVVDAWGSADRAALDTLAERVAADTSLSGKFTREVLLDGRNVALAAKLAQLLEKEEKTVAAIGVMHLLGKNGVPELLRSRGVTVERVY